MKLARAKVFKMLFSFVVGVQSTAFAATNPFEDVPTNHWSYAAVAQLAANGVVKGYDDCTYCGDNVITRYEMAQIVARAIANGCGDKALIDKLTVEFADELNTLGVRVAALEKKVDNTRCPGMVGYRYINRIEEGNNVENRNDHINQIMLRFEPEMKINKHWSGKARIDYYMGIGTNLNIMILDRAWVTCKYSNFAVKFGRFFALQNSDYGMTNASCMSGVEVTIGKDVLVGVRASRMHVDAVTGGLFANANSGSGLAANKTVSYQGIEVYNNRKEKFTWGVGWQHVIGDALANYVNAAGKFVAVAGDGVNNLSIWNAGFGYKFTSDLSFTAAYAHAFGLGNDHAPYGESSAAFRLNYKGANKDKSGSWGVFLAYRHLGFLSTIHPHCRDFGMMNSGEKGWEIGVSYSPMKNIVGRIQYYKGEELATGAKVGGIWSEFGFFF